MLSLGRGVMPAETGVAGLVAATWGDGNGSDAVLRRASSGCISRADGLFDSEGAFVLGLDDDDGREPFLPLGLRGPAERLPSGPTKLLPSLARFNLALDGMLRVLCGFAGSFSFSLVSTRSSASGFGLRAWATARGPAHCGIIGRATLARTKLERTVTGRTFSLIFSWRPVSARPKTMCWTLLYTLRQVWKAFVCGFEERSWR